METFYFELFPHMIFRLLILLLKSLAAPPNKFLVLFASVSPLSLQKNFFST